MFRGLATLVRRVHRDMHGMSRRERRGWCMFSLKNLSGFFKSSHLGPHYHSETIFFLSWKQVGDSCLLAIPTSKNARWVRVFIAMVAVALGPKGTVTQARGLAFFFREEN